MLKQYWLVLVAVVACGVKAKLADPSFTPPAAVVIQDAETDGRGEARIGSAKGPLFVDVNSFDRLGRVASGGGTTSAALRKAVRESLADATKQQAVRCSANPREECLVAEHGIFIQLDSLVKTDSSFEALVSSYTTDQRPGSDHSAICRRQRLVRLRSAASGWLIQGRQITRTC